jgi:proteasome accessory factor B
MSRVVGRVVPVGEPGSFTPPADLDLFGHVAQWSNPVAHTNKATVLLRPGRAFGIRRRAESVVSGPDGDRVELRYSDPDSFARWLVGYGSDVVVLEPDDVRKAIVARLRDLVETLGVHADQAHASAGVGP